jgi:RNase P subunit RPR2
MASTSSTDRVRELLKAGVPDREIAAKVGTSISYVRKVKSIDKKASTKGDAIASQPEPIPRSTPKTVTTRPTTASTLLDPIDGETLSVPLVSEAIKVMYSEFKSGHSPVEVLSRHGYNPAAVEAEYSRYLDLAIHDQSKLLRRILDQVITRPGSKTRHLLSKYKEMGAITDDQLIQLLKINNDEIHSSAIEGLRLNMIDTSSELPAHVKRLTCSMCGSVIRSLLAVEIPGLGDPYSNIVCPNCG